MKKSTRSNLKSHADKASAADEDGTALPGGVEELSHTEPLEARDTLLDVANAPADRRPKEQDISLREVEKILTDISNTITAVASHAAEQENKTESLP